MTATGSPGSDTPRRPARPGRRGAPGWIAVLATAFAVVSLGIPSRAEAGGLYLPDRGVRPMGRGGALVASGKGDLNSLWYNPANLAGFESTRGLGDLAIIGTFSRFQRAPRTTRNGETVEYDPVSNQALPTPDPQLIFGGPLGIDGLNWAAGFYAPYAVHYRYPADGAQRYSLVDNSRSAMAWFSGGVGWEITDDFRVGAGLQNMIAHFELVTVISGYSGLYGRPEDRDLDLLSKITLEDFFMPTGNAGVWVRPASGFELAASVQLPATVSDKDAEIEARMPSHPSFDNAELSNDTLRAKLNLPVVARFGARFVGDDWDAELAAVFEGWSVFDKLTAQPNDIDVEGVPGVGSLPVGALSIPKNWRDTLSLRLGGSYEFSDSFSARTGYTFETGAPPPEYYSIFNPDPSKHVFAGGTTYRWNDVALDFSAAYYAMENKSIRDSKVRQVNPVDTQDELATVIGNGDYRNSALVVGVGVQLDL